ncbi:MAG: type I DNA topoisomerase [SAR324 cluster bacterium]|nr:type I DNA topoisomerase [SAR324 cluster bacterium]
MTSHLIIVESPAKAKTISRFLGKDYQVVASMGHVRDLPEKQLGFDTESFTPFYEVTKDKKKVISSIKQMIQKDTMIYLATDEDREGEAISWHLLEALGIKKNPVKRIVFHEITQTAIQEALRNPRDVDQQLVDAQQARRILDRAVGYELSPLLWKKIQGGLSAGRVQSVAVRIVVEREREIRQFIPEEYWKIKLLFQDPAFQAELAKFKGKAIRVKNQDEAEAIERNVRQGPLNIDSIEEKDSIRRPVPPFTTSTLQQEASRKLGYSVKQTMSVAQQLYEGNFEIPGYTGGLITYMRTDSVNLAQQAVQQAMDVITQEYGNEYRVKSPRQFVTKTKGAQEAHEAIRPVDLSLKPAQVKAHLNDQQFKLYNLIWKRTLATQMSDAKFAQTTINILGGTDQEYLFQSKGQKLLFAGFLKVYVEGSDNPEAELETNDVLLPDIKKGDPLHLKNLLKEQLFTKPPARYTEASLVKKLESEGIGRPSTYAPTISTIMDRKYVEKTPEKKLIPTHIGEIVTDFLIQHFADIVDLGFTAKIEQDFDSIARGEKQWISVMQAFYQPFHSQIDEKQQSVRRGEVFQERKLGTDPKTGREVSVRVGRFGPMVQIGTKDDPEKPLFASVPKEKNIYDITLEESLKFFDLPKMLGKDAADEEIWVGRGRFGPYIRKGKTFYSLKNVDPLDVSLEQALEVIEQQASQPKGILHEFGDITVRKGPYGHYIKKDSNNYKIPKDQDPNTLTLELCEQIIATAPTPRKKGGRKPAAPAKS